MVLCAMGISRAVCECSLSVRISPVRARCIFKLHSGAAVRVPAGRVAERGREKILKKGWEVLDTQGEKAVNYKLPAKTAGALFDRQREGKKARRMRRHISLPN